MAQNRRNPNWKIEEIPTFKAAYDVINHFALRIKFESERIT